MTAPVAFMPDLPLSSHTTADDRTVVEPSQGLIMREIIFIEGRYPLSSPSAAICASTNKSKGAGLRPA